MKKNTCAVYHCGRAGGWVESWTRLMDDWQARLEPSKTTKKSGIHWIPFIANFTHDIDITSVKMHMISSTIPCSSMIPCWTTFSPPWFSNPTDHHYQTCQYHPSIDICYQQSHQTSMPQTIGRCCHDAANCALNACIQNRMRYEQKIEKNQMKFDHKTRSVIHLILKWGNLVNERNVSQNRKVGAQTKRSIRYTATNDSCASTDFHNLWWNE